MEQREIPAPFAKHVVLQIFNLTNSRGKPHPLLLHWPHRSRQVRVPVATVGRDRSESVVVLAVILRWLFSARASDED